MAEPIPRADAPVERLDSARHAYEELRARVLSGALPPDTVFSQVQLATEIGVSRTPLREAIRRLQSEGLLQSERNRRVRVSPLSTSDFEDLYAMRITLDSLAVRISVPHLSDEDVDGVRAAFGAMTDAISRLDMTAYHEPHRSFHFGLIAHAGGRLIARAADLWDHAERYRHVYQLHAAEGAQLIELANEDHAALLAAGERRDGDACATAMAAHLARTALMAMYRVDHRHDPAKIRAALDLVGGDEVAPLLPPAPADPEGDDAPVPGYRRD